MSLLLVGITGVGLVFSLWLTYLELFVIDAICQWCVFSAILATQVFLVCWLDLRDVDSWVDDIAQQLRGE